MNTYDAEVIAAALLKRSCCPLGAAMLGDGVPPVIVTDTSPFLRRNPSPTLAASTLGIDVRRADEIVGMWDDEDYGGHRRNAILEADRAGLTPKIRALIARST